MSRRIPEMDIDNIDSMYKSFDYDDSIKTKEYLDRLLQEGFTFNNTIKTTIASGQTFYAAGTTKDKSIKIINRFIQVINTSQAVETLDVMIKIYRDNIFTGGTTITNYNENENFADLDTTDWENKSGVTITTLGTDRGRDSRLYSISRGAVQADTLTDKYVFKKNSNYVISVTNNGTSSVDVIIRWILAIID